MLARTLTRLGPRAGLLIAVPFPLLMWATEAEITTEIARNGAGYQRIRMAFPEERAEPVARTRDIEKAYPQRAGWTRPRSRRRGGEIVFTTDKRRGGIERYEEASLQRGGSWLFSFWTTYRFHQQITVSNLSEYADRVGSPTVYRLRMPGVTVSSNADVPATGPGVWLEWQIPAGDEPITVQAESKVFRCGYATLILFLALWSLGWAARTFIRWRRAQPKRI